jgi:hypothetical protein
MDGEEAVKKFVDGKRGGGEEIGRPIFRWLDDVELDLRNLGVNIWTRRALDRTAWASVVRRAEAKLKGCIAEKEKRRLVIWSALKSSYF